MINSIINTERYPIDNPCNPDLRTTIDSAHKTFSEHGAVQLPEFLRAEVVEQLITGAIAAKPDAHYMQGEFPPYSDAMDDKTDTSLPADHPSHLRLPASHLFLPGDLITRGNPLRTLYTNPEFQNILQEILGVSQLHTVADEMGSVNMLIYQTGDRNGWHFDTTDFVVSIMLQPATSGGHYQYLTDLRAPEYENLAEIALRMRNPDDQKNVQHCTLQTASLFLFKGKYTMHRVTEVCGQTERIIAILSYHPRPGHMISASSKRAMYGRESPLASNLAF